MPVTINGDTGVVNPDGSASAPSIVGSDSNTGVFFPAADTVGIATNGVSRMQVASDGTQSSVIPGGSTLYNEYKCRAWVNFDGTTTPPTVRGSAGVTSVTRNATADYTVNFSFTMPDVNYTCTGVCYNPPSAASIFAPCTNTSGTEQAPTTTTFRFSVIQRDGGLNNTKYTFAAFFR